MKRLLFALPAALLVALVVAFAFGLQRNPAIIPSTLINRELPAFALPSVYPEKPGLANTDFRGTPRLLNIFASWCTACRIEHPLLLRLKREGWPIFGLDWRDDPKDAEQWLTQMGDPYVQAINDQDGHTGIDLGVTGVPESYVIDATGRVRYKHVGPITEADWQGTLKPLLEKLAREAAPQDA